MSLTEVVDITEPGVPDARAFLERTFETSLFLLSNLRAFGPRLGEGLYSGNFKGLRDASGLCAVFCLTRGGTLVVQTGGRIDLAPEILDAVKAERLPIRGVLGEWQSARAIWDLLRAEGRVTETIASKELLYRLSLAREWPEQACGLVVRMLVPEDHDQWHRLSEQFQQELGLPVQGDRAQREAGYVRSSRLGHWWGAFDGAELVSLSGIIALHKPVAQIGGVFTIPERRRRGINRAVLTKLAADSRSLHHLDRLILFTSEDNVIARRLYESLGFDRVGYFGLFFGEPRA